MDWDGIRVAVEGREEKGRGKERKGSKKEVIGGGEGDVTRTLTYNFCQCFSGMSCYPLQL